MEENKYHLTVKNLRLLKWFIKNCPRADFLIKADDDAFLNIPVLNAYLHTINSTILSKGYIGGLVHEGRAAHSRNPFSKWEDRFPYIHG
ncbi:unnamed protein product [Allacma fusca]|uniref:Hexosyltransferase n=1 Tax=Allacma fusca TaxID=39272 RepID=A0A8J2L2F3_9HEXA|nr:unnamed protein product [Allacma fusca]